MNKDNIIVIIVSVLTIMLLFFNSKRYHDFNFVQQEKKKENLYLYFV